MVFKWLHSISLCTCIKIILSLPINTLPSYRILNSIAMDILCIHPFTPCDHPLEVGLLYAKYIWSHSRLLPGSSNNLRYIQYGRATGFKEEPLGCQSS